MEIIQSKKELFYLLLLFVVLLLLRGAELYIQYLSFKQEPLVKLKARVVNHYDKKDHRLLKLQSGDLIFFTRTKQLLVQDDELSLVLLTQSVEFIGYVKGFFAKSFNHVKLASNHSALEAYIKAQHQEVVYASIFQALFLAKPLKKAIKERFSSLGISHLIAISGFHLGVLSAIIYSLLRFPYLYFQQRYFPYRNRRFDLMVIVLITLFAYLLLTNLVPSLLRAFLMLGLGFYLLRSHIKIFSYLTLLIVSLIIFVLFPRYIFSLGLWFSIAGVFYIYLFLDYFKKLSKLIGVIWFNIWLFMALNPIIHYFFEETSLAQLFSPLLTMLFVIFYPLALFLHLIGVGYLLDFILACLLTLPIEVYEIKTNGYVMGSYVILSLLAIKDHRAFIALNALMISYNVWMYIK